MMDIEKKAMFIETVIKQLDQANESDVDEALGYIVPEVTDYMRSNMDMSEGVIRAYGARLSAKKHTFI